MIRNLIRNKTVFAVLNIVLGIYMCAAGQNVINTISRVAGYGLLGAAVIYAAMYFLGQGSRDQVKLGYAIAAGVAGLLLMWLAPAIVKLIPRLAGIALILFGGVNLAQAYKNGMPLFSMAGPALTALLGILVLLRPGFVVDAAMMIAGIALILNGLSELDMIRRVW